MIVERWGKLLPLESKNGMVITSDSVMAPRAPEKVITSIERMDCLPSDCFASARRESNHTVSAIQRNRTR